MCGLPTTERPTRINRHRDRAAYVVARRRLRFQGTHRRTRVAIRLQFLCPLPETVKTYLPVLGFRVPNVSHRHWGTVQPP